MQQVRATLAPFTLRSRSLLVGHVGSGLTQGLEPGQHVLVHDEAAGLHHTAVVADIDFELEDTVYRLELRGRITATEAAEWLQPAHERPADRLTTADIAELLETLRRTTVDATTAWRELAEG
jgi:hypothetical protein